MKKSVLLFCFFIAIGTLHAGENAMGTTGIPLVRNYAPRMYHAHSQNFDVAQDKRGILYFANTSGVLEHDGVSWRLIPAPNGAIVRSLAADSLGRIFVGARGDFGKITFDSLGRATLVSLLSAVPKEHRNFLDIWRTFSMPQGICFISQQYIFLLSGSQVRTIVSEREIVASFLVGSTLYVQQNGVGLTKLVGDTLEKVAGGEYFAASTELTAILPADNGALMIATASQGLFLLHNGAVTPFHTSADNVLTSGRITCGLRLSDGSLAFGTVRRGVLLFNAKAELQTILDRSTGLQNENIKDLFTDSQGGLWLALNNGISRVDFPSPLSFLDESLGPKGGVTAITRFNGALYVATYQGLYRLTNGQSAPVPGISLSCWALTVTPNALLIATTDGVYALSGDKLTRVSNGLSFALHRSRKNPSTVYVGRNNGLGILTQKAGAWTDGGDISGAGDEIRAIAEDESGNLWMTTPSKGVLRINVADAEDKSATFTRLDTAKGLPAMLGNRVSLIGTKAIFSTNNGLFQFNESAGRFEPFRTFGTDSAGNALWLGILVEDKAGNIWTSAGNEVNSAVFRSDKGKFIFQQTPFLPIADFRVWAIFPDDNDIVWFGGPDGLARYDARIEKNYKMDFHAFIRKIGINGEVELFAGTFADDATGTAKLEQSEGKYAELNYHQNTLRFEFSAANYEHPSAMQFRYFLMGNDADWSEWTRETSKEYTNLAEGKYIFKVQARNVYGHISDEATYHFEILRPWFKMWWAYLLYVAALGGVIFLAVQWRLRQAEKEKRALEKIIDDRTREVVKQKDEIESKSSELASKNDELEKINAIVKSINAEIDFAHLLSQILEKTKRSIRGTERASALVRDGEHDEFIFKANFGWEEGELDNKVYSLAEAENLFLSETEEVFEDIFSTENGNAKSESRAVMVVVVEGKTEGFIVLENTKNAQAFDEHDFGLLKNLKEHIISAFIKTRILANLQTTLGELQDTQQQLVQSEKLAELGQLTAGIAHEIQNPLNFVNNFAELSIGLAEELREEVDKIKGIVSEDLYYNFDDITGMLDGNVRKIKEHGKRAEGIVKGMLMHSRGKSGEFALTDLNAMTQEYVNLAYHGMRAADTNFNVTLETSYDTSLEKINVVPQDLSRVILNIVNNACYAVHEYKTTKAPAD